MKFFKKKGALKRTAALIITVCFILAMIPAAGAEETNKSYVVLGDSISTGYGLGDEESSFAETLAQMNSFDINVLAEDGQDSAALLETISAPASAMAISKADVITITIGGNDLMNALCTYLANKYNETVPNANKSPEEIKEELIGGNTTTIMFATNAVSGFIESKEALTALMNFSTNLTKIVFGIKTLNPDVLLVVANQYNPYSYLAKSMEGTEYYEMFASVNDTFNIGIASLNSLINSICTKAGCITADVYTAINEAEENPCNAYVLGLNKIYLDIHPNAYGHGIIADVFNEAMKYEVYVTHSSLDLGEQKEGYEEITGQTIAVKNIGTQALSNISVALGGENADSFTLNTDNTAEALEPGETTTFTAAPAAGLAAGEYSAYAEITADNFDGTKAEISFSVAGKTTITGIEDNKVYCGPIEVELSEDVIKATVNGREVEIADGKVVIDAAEGVQKVVFEDASGEEYIYNVTVNSGHTTVVVNQKDATCTEEGYTGDEVCTVCGEIINKGTVIEKLDHNYEDGACTVCGELDPNYKLGDVNMDGDVKIEDATYIQMYSAQLNMPVKFSKALADVNGDGNINVMDATYVQIMLTHILLITN